MGLGTDVAGGYSPSMLCAMRHAVVGSKLVHCRDPGEALTIFDALHLATVGGARVLDLESTVRRFDSGFAFDAVLLDNRKQHSTLAHCKSGVS